MRSPALALVAALLLAPAPAGADPLSPGPGTGWTIAGGVLTGSGAATLAVGLPACATIQPPQSAPEAVRTASQASQTACTWTTVAFGGGMLVMGIPLIVVGGLKRADWLRGMSLAPSKGGASLGWTASF